MKRRGTSLMEVLIAIFILALGLVSLLTLFPIGFVQMAKSVQDERAAQLAANAAAYMRTTWKDACEAGARRATGGQPMFCDVMSLNGFWSAMDDPNIDLSDFELWKYLNNKQNQNVIVPRPINDAAVFPQLITMVGDPAIIGTQRLSNQARLTRASYPVFVDPVGFAAAGADLMKQHWVAPRTSDTNPNVAAFYSIPRRSISQMAMKPVPTVPVMTDINRQFDYKRNTMRNCMLQDDMDFKLAPANALTTNDTVNPDLQNRFSQYSCAWLLRRDNNSKRTETNVTVVVYHRRSIESLSDEIAFHVNAQNDTPERAVAPVALPPSSVPNQDPVYPNSITLIYRGDKRPPLRRGSWILDATIDPAPAPPGPPNPDRDRVSEVQGFYYRVTDFTETETATPGVFQNVLQLETRLRPRQVETDKFRNPALPQPSPRFIVVQDRVLEVFDKGPLEMNSSSRIN